MDIFVTEDIDDFDMRPILNSISKNIRFGISIYEELLKLSHYTYDIHDLVVISLFRKLLEQSDGVFVLVDHNSWSAAYITSRSIIEVYVSLLYIIDDNNLMKKRALSYILFHKEEELKILKKEKTRDILALRYETNELNTMKNELNKMRNESPFNEIVKKKNDLINKERRNKKRFVKWYSLYNKEDEEIFSITDLIRFVDSGNSDNKLNELYSLLSKEVHGVNTIKDIKINNKKAQFEGFRVENKTIEKTFGFINAIIAKVSLKLIQMYMPERINDFHSFFMRDRIYRKLIDGSYFR